MFPNVARVCNKLGVTSHGLALYMLQGADEKFGIACLGGECFGQAGAGFLRFSCAEPNDRLQQALDFIPKAIARTDRLAAWLDKNPQYRLAKPYVVEWRCESRRGVSRSYVKPVMPFTGPSIVGADTVLQVSEIVAPDGFPLTRPASCRAFFWRRCWRVNRRRNPRHPGGRKDPASRALRQ